MLRSKHGRNDVTLAGRREALNAVETLQAVEHTTQFDVGTIVPSRRRLVLGLLATYASRVRAQASPRRIGLLFPWKEEVARGYQAEILRELRDLGYRDPTRLNLAMRAADGDERRLPALAGELVEVKAELIVTAGTNATVAMRRASPTIPIVFMFVSDPVRSGLVDSLARPGRNMTGLTNFSGGELASKRLALLYELLPGLKRLALLINPITNTGNAEQRVQRWAEAWGFKGIVVRATSLPELSQAFKAMRDFQAQAVLVQVDTFFEGVARQIAELALSDHLPSVFDGSVHVELGGLMSYGPVDSESTHRVASYVDKILRGQSAGEIPIEQPTRLELIINRRTAESLALKIPRALLLQADRVVE